MDSLNIREWRDTACRLSGDPALARALIPVARKLLGAVGNQAKLSGIGHIQRNIRFSDGSLIRVIANGALRIIEIDVRAADGSIKTLAWRFFVETGWVHLSEINCMDEIDKAAGLLTVTDDMEAWVHDSEKPYVDWLVTDGFKNTRDYQDGMESLALPRFVYETEEEREQNRFDLTDFDRLMGAKSVMARKYLIGCGLEVDIQYPSACGGKLKYLFQSVLGRDKPTASVIELVGDPMVGTSGFGLFTTTEWRYYVIRIIANTIKVYETTQPSEAVVLRAALAEESDFEQRKRLEAYLLSITYIDGDNLQSVSLNGSLGIQGASLAYGWHFSWHGHEASIVTHYNDDEDDFYANLYTLEFSENTGYDAEKVWSKDNLPISYKLTHKEKDVKWWAAPQLPLWVPFFQLGRMVIFNPRYDYDHQEFAFDTPVYCFYDHTVVSNETDSKLVVVRAVVELDTVNITELEYDSALPDIYDIMRAFETWNPGNYRFSTLTYSALFSFYTVGHHEDVEKAKKTENSGEGELLLEREFNGNLSGPINANPAQNYLGYYYVGAFVASTAKWYNKEVVIKSVLIVPYQSSEAAYVGSCTYDFRDGQEEYYLASVHDGIIHTEDVETVGSGNWHHYAQLDWGMHNLGPGGGVGYGIISNEPQHELNTVTSELQFKIRHSYGSETVKFRENQSEIWTQTNENGTPPDLQEWEIFVTPSLVLSRDTDILFHFHNGIGEAAYFTNDISMENVDGHFAWQCVGGLTFDQMGGYFVGWA